MLGREKKSKGTTGTATPKKTTTKATKGLQSLPISSSLLQELLNDLDMSRHQAGSEKDILARVMAIFIDISSRLEDKEQGMEELKATWEEAPGWAQSMSATPASCTCQQRVQLPACRA